MQVGFVNTENEPISTVHVCFYATTDGDEISLHEIVVETYPHPDAPEELTINLTTTRHIKTVKRNGAGAGALVLLEAAQNNCKELIYLGRDRS